MNSEPALDPAAMGIPVAVISALIIVAMFLWILLPFAVFGVKKRLDESLRLQREQLLVLAESADALRTLASDVSRQVRRSGQHSAPSPASGEPPSA